MFLFLSSLVFAAEAMNPEQMLADCEQKWGNRISAVAQCLTNLRLAQAEATDVAIVAELEEDEERDQAILASVDELGDKVERISSAFEAARAVHNPSQPTLATGTAYTQTGGAAWVPVAQPTVVSIHNITGMVPDTFHITDLDHPTARKTCGGVGAPLVAFFDHGVPVSNVYAPAGAPTGFVEVYYDKQNDGIPDGKVMALDLQSQDDVWITWGLQNDLTVRYLRPGGQIAVAGLPLQTVYHSTLRAETTGAIGCDDEGTPRGGHKADHAYSLSRMWQ